MADACSTDAGRAVVRLAVQSLLAALRTNETPLDAGTLDLLGIDGRFTKDLERDALEDVARAFLDLMDGVLSCNASSADIIPGSKPYRRSDAAGD